MGCPSWERLLDAHELGLLTKEQRRALEEHALDCDACFEQLYESANLSETFRERRRDAADVDSGIRVPGRRPWVAWAGLAAALLVAAVALVMLRPAPVPDATLRGGEETPAVLAFSPRGPTPLPQELTWSPVPLASAYEVEIWRADGASLWHGQVAAPPARLPDDIRRRLRVEQTYAWQVHAVGKDGERWASERLEFTVQP